MLSQYNKIMNNIQKQSSPNLEIRTVGSLTENFTVPDYQRGYRWERSQVRRLLDDIRDSDPKMPYYLQPIVVAPNNNGGYDLIDGQQRLTTLYLIGQFLTEVKGSMQNNPYNPLNSIDTVPHYTISYITRPGSAAFLTNIAQMKLSGAQAAPDFLYMWHAYGEIREWFNKDNSDKIGTIARTIKERVKIIWYEIGYSVDCWEKFADLNVGKIPLTNSELVKALFMRDTPKCSFGITEQEKSVIVDQWDSMERELHDPLVWGFLTNSKQEKYDTLIDLIFDIIAHKGCDENDDFYTFLYFEKEMNHDKATKGKENWDDIYLQYQRLHDWYEDRSLYHKIGYLITQDDKGNLLSELFKSTREKGHNELNSYIDERIRESIKPQRDSENKRLNDLRYGVDNKMIERVLTLFNVLTMDQMEDSTQRYSFFHHKNVNGGWSLEHIHAQHSDGLNTAEQWETWVRLHRKSLLRYRDYVKTQNVNPDADESASIDKLLERMDEFLQGKNVTSMEFTGISSKFFETISPQRSNTSEDLRDEMANMALLGKDDNSMLNNSIFDVKRELIIKAMSNSYIPICTQKVFLKAYAPAEGNQLFFWGELDREEYIKAMEETLKDYLWEGYVTIKEQFEEQENSKEKEEKEEENEPEQ